MDLMRLLAGDARWCFARLWQDGRPARKGNAHPGGEGMGPILGDRVTALYGFDYGLTASFGTACAAHGAGSRFALFVYGTPGVLRIGTGSLPPVHWLDDPSWAADEGGPANWRPITSAGFDQPEQLKDDGLALGNRWIAADLIDAIDNDRPPKGSMYDGRAALEMILAVYESFRQDRAVDLPLKNRRHPLTLL
jgi:hypothetical protein